VKLQRRWSGQSVPIIIRSQSVPNLLRSSDKIFLTVQFTQLGIIWQAVAARPVKTTFRCA
jgi:hypothetical protein